MNPPLAIPSWGKARIPYAVARQFFFVLAGRLLIEVEGNHHTLGPYEGLEVAPGLVHEVRNDSAEPVDFLVISQPPSHGDRMNVASERSATSG